MGTNHTSLGTNQPNLGSNRLNLGGYETTVGTNRLETLILSYIAMEASSTPSVSILGTFNAY